MRSAALIFMMLICYDSMAQKGVDSTLQNQLPAATVATFRKIDYGFKMLGADSATLSIYKAQNAAALIAQQFAVFVKSYGTNGLATLSLRGASSAQTAVRWNGVPMQSGNTGLVDLFTIPVSTLSQLEIDYGAGSGYTGSGAVGGVLLLTSAVPDFSPRQSIGITVGGGSYGNFFSGLTLKKSSTKFFASVDVSTQRTDNNFAYENESGITEKLANAAARQWNATGTFAYKWNAHNRLSVFIWKNRTVREIPPALFEAYSVKSQEDAALRSVLTFAHSGNAIRYGLLLSDFEESFHYSDSAIRLQSAYDSRQLFANAWTEWDISSHFHGAFSIPIQANYLPGDPSKALKKIAGVGAITGLWNKVSLNANARLEHYNAHSILAGGINADLLLQKSFKVRASFGNTYRAPTLNELYYAPGGNPNLAPERGWSGEAGYDWKRGTKNTALIFSHSGTAFYRDIHDWIIWFGGAIWTPHNISEVVSRGLETENKLTYRRPKIIYQLAANATIISSQTIKSELPNDGSIGHQIPYAPRMIAQGNAGINTAKWRFNYIETFTGDRYFNTDETGLLPAFATGNIQAGFLLKKKGWAADLAISLQNIWDARYAEVSGRPAPGRNVLLSATISGTKVMRSNTAQ